MLTDTEKGCLAYNIDRLIVNHSKEDLFVLSCAVAGTFNHWKIFRPDFFDFSGYCEKNWRSNCHDMIKNHNVANYVFYLYEDTYGNHRKKIKFQNLSTMLYEMFRTVTEISSTEGLTDNFIL